VSSAAVRHRVVSALLQSEGSVTEEDLADICGLDGDDVCDAVQYLAAEGLAVRGHFIPGAAGPQCRWAASWARELQGRTARMAAELADATGAWPALGDHELDVLSPASVAFSDYILSRYRPPEDKRLLVFLQCSVRRPFSKSPSHASMRRAIWVATGRDPRADFPTCPVHVVVLASKIGPVPYELEDAYPANVRGGGVKHFDPLYYDRVWPVLAGRVSAYLQAHGEQYDHIATFTEGRYAEVMTPAAEAAGREVIVLPMEDGPRATRIGASQPRTYWEKRWIQLSLRLLDWLGPQWRTRAAQRLAALDVVYEGT